MGQLLLLGGTADGRILAERLHQQGVSVIYSIAGLVRTPNVACKVVSGGFTQWGGLAAFVRENNIRAILDVTHPYAEIMSTKALNAAHTCAIPYWRFHRAQWQQREGDNWQFFTRWEDALVHLKDKASVLLTAGQLEQSFIDQLQRNAPNQQQLLRTAVKPKAQLPESMQWIKAIGPFAYGDELALMQAHKIDVLLSKNSGGDATAAKLQAAREWGIPVLMLQRPTLPAADQLLLTREACEHFILDNQHVF